MNIFKPSSWGQPVPPSERQCVVGERAMYGNQGDLGSNLCVQITVHFNYVFPIFSIFSCKINANTYFRKAQQIIRNFYWPVMPWSLARFLKEPDVTELTSWNFTQTVPWHLTRGKWWIFCMSRIPRADSPFNSKSEGRKSLRILNETDFSVCFVVESTSQLLSGDSFYTRTLKALRKTQV